MQNGAIISKGTAIGLIFVLGVVTLVSGVMTIINAPQQTEVIQLVEVPSQRSINLPETILFSDVMSVLNDGTVITSARHHRLMGDYEGKLTTFTGTVADVRYNPSSNMTTTSIVIETEYQTLVFCYVLDSLSDEVIDTYNRDDVVTCTGELNNVGFFDNHIVVKNATPTRVEE